MNKKIYLNKSYLLLSDSPVQQTGNQVIVNTNEESHSGLKIYLDDFIQQSPEHNLVFITKDVNETFEFCKEQFKFIEAAGGLIRNREGNYLVIHRLGHWDLPKGKLDKGEGRQHAAVRECEEECGISGLSILKELPSSFHIYPHKKDYALKITYWYLMETNFTGRLVPQTEENIDKAEWMSVSDIKNIVLADTYPAIADVLGQVL